MHGQNHIKFSRKGQLQPYVILIINCSHVSEILTGAFFRNITYFSHLWLLEMKELQSF